MLLFLAVFCVVARLHATEVGLPKTFPYAVSDSDKTKKDKAGTSPRTIFSEDSILKPDNIFLPALGLGVDTATRYKRNEVQKHWYTIQGFQSNDSGRYYKSEGCLKIELRPRATRLAKDTIVWRDTCSGVVCTPMIGDADRIYNNLCDSIRIIGKGPHIGQPYWQVDPLSGLVKDLVIPVDTIPVPLAFQIYTSRGTHGAQQDTVAATPMTKMFSYSLYFANGYGYPLWYATTYVRGFSWTSRETGGSLTGGRVALPLPTAITAGKQLYVKWVTNPASRNSGNNKTKISLWTADITAGSATNTLTNIGIIEIDDDGHTSSDPNQILVNLTVWVYRGYGL